MNHPFETFAGSRHFHLQEVADGIFAAISLPGTGSVGNAAIINLGDTTLVVDTFNTIEAAMDLKEAAISLTGNSVAYVVNTHWHSDHTSGNQVFSPAAQIISTSATREIMATFGKKRLRQLLENPESVFQDIEDFEKQIPYEKDEKVKKEMLWESLSDREYMKMLPDLVYTLPSVTFDQELHLYGSRRTAQLITFGGGHTESDTIVYLPEEKIAIMGDLVLSNHHPVMIHANPYEWQDILEKVEQLNIEKIIPGHGEVCSTKEILEVKGYIKNIIDLVQETVENKVNIDEIPLPKAYHEWYFTTFFKTNLKKVYEFILKMK